MKSAEEDVEWPWEEASEAGDKSRPPRLSPTDAAQVKMAMAKKKRAKRAQDAARKSARQRAAEAASGAKVANTAEDTGDDAKSEQKDWVLARKYKIRELLGKTEHGRLYRAMQQPLDRPVFIHIIPIRYRSADEVKTLRRHIRRAADVRHRNVTSVQDVDVTRGGMMYVVFEDRSQHTLRDPLKGQTPLGILDSVLVGLQIARGLRAAHEENVAHFSLCPENILLASFEDTDVPTAIVFGFGLSPAQLASDARRSSDGQTYLPTLHNYLAPEQIAGDDTSFRTDVYGLGVLLYEMLAGRPPFEADNAVNTLYAKIQGDVASLKSMPHLRFLPAELERLVLKCIHRDPQERYATMDDVVGELKQIIPQVEQAQRLAEASGPNPASVQALVNATAPPLSVADAISDALAEPDDDDDDLEILDDADVLEASDSNVRAPGPSAALSAADKPFPVRPKVPPSVPLAHALTFPDGPPPTLHEDREPRAVWPYVVVISLVGVAILWFFAVKNPPVPASMTQAEPFAAAAPTSKIIPVRTTPAGLKLIDASGRGYGTTPTNVKVSKAVTLFAENDAGVRSAPLTLTPTMDVAEFDLRLAFGVPINDADGTPKVAVPDENAAAETPAKLPVHVGGLPVEPLPPKKPVVEQPPPPARKPVPVVTKTEPAKPPAAKAKSDLPTGADWLETDPPQADAPKAAAPPQPKPKVTAPPPAKPKVEPKTAPPAQKSPPPVAKPKKRRPAIDMLDD